MRFAYRILMVFLAVSCFLFPSSLLAKSITQATTNEKLSVTMTTPEDGLSVGKNSVTLKIFDADGLDVVGATVNVKPWMPGMGHGVFLVPTVQEKGKGVYDIDDVGFSMPGHWQLIVSVKTDSNVSQTTFEFQDIAGEMGAGCACGADCKCEHCTTGKGPCACKVGGKAKGCACGADCKCEHCTTGKRRCGCQAGNIPNCKCGPGCTKLMNCNCGPDCKCPKDGKGGCGCKVGCATGCKKGRACPLPKPLGT